MATRKKITTKQTKRTQILDAGIRLFARVSFMDMTIAAVAREANCGHSLVYHYFKNINELYDEAIAFIVSNYYPLAVDLQKQDVPAELLFVGIIARLVDELKDNPMAAYYLSLIAFEHDGAPYNERILKIHDKWLNAAVTVIRNAQTSGALITVLSAEDILKTVQTMFQGLISAKIFNASLCKNAFKASDLYLPFLQGVHNV